MQRNKLFFGSRFHVPPGLPDSELEEYYERVCKPFLSLLYAEPSLPAVLFYSGPLLSWLERRHPEFQAVMNELLGRKQIDILGGPFFDPVFGILNRQDRIGQVELLTTCITRQFGKRPRGAVLPELDEWDHGFPSSLRTAGIEYLLVDQSVFLRSGFSGRDRFLPLLAEDQGKVISVLPVLNGGCDWFYGRIAEDALHFLCEQMGGDEMLCGGIFPDGGYHGSQPSQVETLLESGWLADFSSAYSRLAVKVELLHPSRILKLNPASRKGLLLGEERIRKNLLRYEELANLRAKTQYVEILLSQIKGDKARRKNAQEEIWKAWNHSVYAHGSGFYDARIRKDLYRSLILAEKMTRQTGMFTPSIVKADFDLDNQPEYLYQGRSLNAYVHRTGGRLFELDHIAGAWNYLDTVRRHPELCHTAGEYHDSYDRKMFLDHILEPRQSHHDFRAGLRAASFAERDYSEVKCDRERSELVLLCRANLPETGCLVEIMKKFIFKQTSINLYYSIKNLDLEPAELRFASELNVSLRSADASDVLVHANAMAGGIALESADTEIVAVTDVVLEDLANSMNITISMLEPATLWSSVLETLCRCGGQERRYYQAHSLVPVWNLSLEPGAVWENRLTVRFERRQADTNQGGRG